MIEDVYNVKRSHNLLADCDYLLMRCCCLWGFQVSFLEHVDLPLQFADPVLVDCLYVVHFLY